MAGYENIRDANEKRTPEERRELAKKAGKASGQARRRKADFRKTLNLLLTAEIDNEEWKPVLESLGVECTLESALLMYRWVWLGEAIGVDELIYYMFSDRHRQKPDPDRRYDRIYIGGDYGQQNATTFEAFGLDTYRKKFPGLGEYYHSGRESGRQKSPSEYARDLVEFMDGLHEQYENRIFYIFLDPSAKGLAEEVRRATRTGLDYQVFLRDAENDVALGISRVQKALVFDIMSISPKQEYAVQEFGTYEYDKKSIEKGKEVPVKEADHCMDAIRYVVMGAWSNIKHWLPLDIVEDDVNIGDIGSREVREEDEYL